jgi:hypothetical protein
MLQPGVARGLGQPRPGLGAELPRVGSWHSGPRGPLPASLPGAPPGRVDGLHRPSVRRPLPPSSCSSRARLVALPGRDGLRTHDRKSRWWDCRRGSSGRLRVRHSEHRQELAPCLRSAAARPPAWLLARGASRSPGSTERGLGFRTRSGNTPQPPGDRALAAESSPEDREISRDYAAGANLGPGTGSGCLGWLGRPAPSTRATVDSGNGRRRNW